MSDIVLKTENLGISFGGLHAVQDVNLEIRKKQLYGLVGPNGAGKSTFLRHAAGVYKQDSGSLLIDGSPIFENTAVKARISYIPDAGTCHNAKR